MRWIIMTLGDKPDLSIHAHPITRKVWMTITYEPLGYHAMSGTSVRGSVEIFEDGFVIFFDQDGTRTYSKKYNSQDSAIDTLQTRGYKLRK